RFVSSYLLHALGANFCLHDALPISIDHNVISNAGVGILIPLGSVSNLITRNRLDSFSQMLDPNGCTANTWVGNRFTHADPECLRSEEHTSELQSREKLVCRLLLEKK